MIKLSIVTIHYHCEDVLQGLLDSAPSLGPLPEVEWIIIDHSPARPALDRRLKFPTNVGSVRVIEYPQQKGFGEGCNLGAKNSSGSVLFFLNPDCRFQGGSILDFAERVKNGGDTAVLSPLLLTPQGKAEFSFAAFPGMFSEARMKIEKRLCKSSALVQRLVDRRFKDVHSVGWVTGGALFVRRDAFFQVGGFDDEFFLYYEDTDLCLRLSQAGYRACFDPSFTMIHDHGHGGSTEVPKGKPVVYRHSQIRYYQKHKSPLLRAMLKLYLKLSGKYPN